MIDSGTVSSPVNLGGNTLTDSTKNWANNIHKNRLVRIVSDGGSGQLAVIDGNSSNTLLIRGTWPQRIAAGANYVIVGLNLPQDLKDVFGAGTNVDLRSIDDGLQSIGFEHRQGRSLDDFYEGYLRSVAGVATRPALDNYWTAAGLTIPANYTTLALFSRRPFNYGAVVMNGRFSTFALDGQIEFVGFEHDGGHRIPYLLAYRYANHFNFVASAATTVHLRLDTLLPADYDTADHHYQVKLNKCSGEFYIDDVLKAIMLFGVPEALPTWENNPPYALGSFISGIMGIGQSVCLEIWRDVLNAGANHTFPILNTSANNLVAADGDPLPPRQFALYTQNTATKWTGLATAIAVTSHPVPVWGYARKTLVFQANAAGTLDIQVYAGGAWRSWVPGGITLVANQLEVYNLNGEVPIARCVYTPVGADTITLAEWYLGGE